MADPAPHRRHRFTLDCEADSIEELCHVLDRISLRLSLGEAGPGGVSGAVASGYEWSHTVNPEMTHERYVEQLNAWIEANRRRVGRTA